MENISLKAIFVLVLTLPNIHSTKWWPNERWLLLLERHIGDESRYPQVLLITDEINNSFSPILKEIQYRIMQKRPIIISALSSLYNISLSTVNGSNENNHSWTTIPSLNPPSRSTLFILIHYCRNDQPVSLKVYSKFLLFQHKILGVHTFPKILIIIFCEGVFRHLLLEFWKLKILDVTVLELIDIFETEVVSPFTKAHYIRPLLHHFNPFSNMIVTEALTIGSEWFPNKLANLHGYLVNVGINYPDIKDSFNNLRLDSSGNIESIHGSWCEVTNYLSAALNFTVHWVLYEAATLTNTSINSRHLGSDGFRRDFLDKVIDYYGMPDPLSNNHKYYNIFYTHTVFSASQHGLLAPMKYVEKWNIPKKNSLFFIIIALAVIFVYIAGRLLHFNKRCWQAINIFRAFVGMIAMAPLINHERILFAFILVTSVTLFPGLIGELTELEIYHEPVTRMETLEDVEYSGLTLRGMPTLLPLAAGLNNTVIRNLEMNMTKISESRLTCLRFLAKYRNVTCLISANDGKRLVQYMAASHLGNPLHFVTDGFGTLWWTYLFQRNSPYVTRFSREIQHFVEVGLYENMLYGGSFDKRMQKFWNEFEKYIFIQGINYKIALYIACVGWIIGIVVFLGEIIFVNHT